MFKSDITAKAKLDLTETYLYITFDDPADARDHIKKIQKAILSLAKTPSRCSLAQEKKIKGHEIRQLIIENYCILFTVSAKTASTVGIRHAARLAFNESNS